MEPKKTYPRTQNFLLFVLLLGDILFSYLGLTIGYLLRVKSPLRNFGVEPTSISFEQYQPLLWLGTVFILIVMAYRGLYDSRLLLRPHRAISHIIGGVFSWMLAFLAFSLVFKLEPSISRFFVLLSSITTLLSLITWRFSLYSALSKSSWRERLTQRVVIIGWGAEAQRLVESIDRDENHPYEVVGIISTKNEGHESPRRYLGERLLGNTDDLEALLDKHSVDIAVLSDLDLSKDRMMPLMTLCERRYVSLKIIPSFFQIFVSNLRMQTISGVPILGIEELPITNFHNQILKRTIDVVGALIGMIGSIPAYIILILLIKKESPGPVVYKQTRTGLHGNPFTIYKLRSMRLDAENTGAQWATEGDPRRLKIGAFMREWNLDELPQFWNVLKGDMSLVGPRPERPELIQQFEHEIPHYNPRHEVRPGLTGWAQVNGLRGNTSLVDRIRYDLYYIENWSIWFDLQVMILTFIRRDNAY